MPQAAKFFDPVLGIDIHMVVVPPSPAPVPLPHPFIAMVFEFSVAGLVVSAVMNAVFGGGPVHVNGLPNGRTGVECKAIPHFPTPPGVSFHPCDAPDNKGVIVTGAKTVLFEGSSEGRMGSSVSSCNFPLNLPTSLCLAVPAGAPVDVGGPEAVDWGAALLRGICTRWASAKIRRLLQKLGLGRLSKYVCKLTGHPVDVMNGEVLTDAVDFDLPGPLPLRFERNYYSRSHYRGPLGQGWHHSLDTHLVEDDIEVFLRLPDGRERVHDRLSPRQSLWDDIDRYTLSRTADGYRMTTWDGVCHDYRAIPGATPRGERGSTTYLLLRITDRCDNAVQLFYEKGLLRQVIDSAGRRLEFEHTPEGRLSRIGCNGVDLARYVHDGPHLAAAKDPLGNALRYAYRGGVLVRETNRNGLSFHFEYDWEHPEGWCIRTWGDGGIYDRRITYDKLRHTTIVDDGRGGRTHYFGNEAGLVEREIDPTGVETRYEWDESARKTAEIDGLGHRTEWSFDERGNPTLERDALGHETLRTFNGFNLPEAVIDAAGNQWTIDYDHRGKSTRITNPLGHARKLHHDRRGLLRRVEDALNHRFELSYDDRGHLVDTRDWEGRLVRYTWDVFGRLVEHIDAMGRKTAFAWNACGRLTVIHFPDGSRERRAHDPEGNMIERIDPLDHSTRFRFAGMNKLVEQIDPEGFRVRFEYDVEEDLIALTNELGETYRIDVDLAGRVVRQVGFDGRALVFRYDRAGRCVETMNGLQKVTKLVRDPLGRIIRQMLPGRPSVEAPIPPPEEVLFEYDARGDLLRAKNADADVRFARNANGRIVLEESNGEKIESRFDPCDRRVLRRCGEEHVTAYDFDGNGLLRGVSLLPDQAWLDLDQDVLRAGGRPERAPWSLKVRRDASGHEVERRFTGDVTASWTYGDSGRPAIHDVRCGDTVVFSRTYEWLTNQRIEAITDERGGRTSYDYDRRSFLVAAHRPDGTTQHRIPDAAGNIHAAPDRTDRVYGKGGVLLRAGNESYRHDADGNLVERILPDGRKWSYEWDGAGRLRRVLCPDGEVATYTYDALGRRLSKRIGDHLVQYAWDGNDMIREKRGGSATVRWEIDPRSFAPIAKIEAGKRYSVITDQVGSPMALFDESGQLAWTANIDIHGTARTDVATTDCPWRWAGQYRDDETGLHYNRFRYYDPSTDRYTQRDPLGIGNGRWLYNYVHDPLLWTDPLGLVFGIYEFIAQNDKTYIGKSIETVNRLKQHGDRVKDLVSETTIDVFGAAGNDANKLLRLAEQEAMDLAQLEGKVLDNKIRAVAEHKMADYLKLREWYEGGQKGPKPPCK